MRDGLLALCFSPFQINNQFERDGEWKLSQELHGRKSALFNKLELCAGMAFVLDVKGYLLGCRVWVSG